MTVLKSPSPHRHTIYIPMLSSSSSFVLRSEVVVALRRTARTVLQSWRCVVVCVRNILLIDSRVFSSRERLSCVLRACELWIYSWRGKGKFFWAERERSWKKPLESYLMFWCADADECEEFWSTLCNSNVLERLHCLSDESVSLRGVALLYKLNLLWS